MLGLGKCGMRLAAMAAASIAAAQPFAAGAQDRPSVSLYRTCVAAAVATFESGEAGKPAPRPVAAVVAQAIASCEDKLAPAAQETMATASSEAKRQMATMTPEQQIEAFKAQFRLLATDTFTRQLETQRKGHVH